MQQGLVKATRLEKFPISFFAMVMGLAGLTLTWEKAQRLLGKDLHVTGAVWSSLEPVG